MNKRKFVFFMPDFSNVLFTGNKDSRLKIKQTFVEISQVLSRPVTMKAKISDSEEGKGPVMWIQCKKK